MQIRSIYLPASGSKSQLYRSWRLLGLLLAALVLAACGGGGSSNRTANTGGGTAFVPPPATPAFPAPHSQCSLAVAREDVLDIFEEFYFFNEIPEQVQKYAIIRANLTGYASVDALLDDLRYQSGTFDRGFSYYSTTEEVTQFFEAGEFFGFGFSWGFDDFDAWRLIDVFGGSPADLAGLQRGDTILEIDGTPTALLDPGAEDTFGPSEIGLERTFRIRTIDGLEREVTLAKATVGLDPVPQDRVQVFDIAGRKVGYVFFRTFIEDADDLLRAAFATLNALAPAGIDDLILDLRYNGGGLVDTAEVLGSLMAGDARSGSIFFSYEYNDLVTAVYGGPDDIRQFQLEADALNGFEHVYYLTGGGSASASELIISGLEPYLDRSRVIGASTFGKPVGQWGLEYCNGSMVLFVVTFRTVNVLGEADYYSGIPVDCEVEDDWDHLLGDPSEGRLKAALDYIETNGSLCSAPVARVAAMSLTGAPVFERPSPVEGRTLSARLLNAQ